MQKFITKNGKKIPLHQPNRLSVLITNYPDVKNDVDRIAKKYGGKVSATGNSGRIEINGSNADFIDKRITDRLRNDLKRTKAEFNNQSFHFGMN